MRKFYCNTSKVDHIVDASVFTCHLRVCRAGVGVRVRVWVSGRVSGAF